MWGNLKNVGFKVDLKSIVNAVAPPVESDDDDDYDNDGDSQDDDIISEDLNEAVGTEPQDEYDDDDEDEYEEDQPRGFGLVGMLSRALESEQHRYEDSQSHEEEDQFDRGEVIDLSAGINTSLSTRSFHSDSFQGESMLNDSFQGESTLDDVDMHEENDHHHASYLDKPENTHRTPVAPEPPIEEPEEHFDTRPTPAQEKDSSEKEAPLWRPLVRETGSLSPAARSGFVQVPLPALQPLMAEASESATKQQNSSESENSSTATPREKGGDSLSVSARASRLPTPSGTRRSEPVASEASTLETKVTTKGSRPVPASRTPLRSSSDTKALENLPGLPSFIAPGLEQMRLEVERNHNAAPSENDTDSDRSRNKDTSVAETADTASATKVNPKQNDKSASTSPPSERPTPALGSQDEAVVDNDEDEEEEEDTQSLERGNLGSQHDALIRDDYEEEEEETHSFGEEEEEEQSFGEEEEKPQSFGEDNGQQKEQNSISTGADDFETKQERRATDKPTVQEIPKLVTTSSDHAFEGETTNVDLRSNELERQLRQAEMHIVELQQRAARQMEMEEESQQRQLQRFQEKEARLLEAAAEDLEQELGLLRNDMDSKFAALQQERERERKELVRERDQMERLLNEAISTVDAAEREKKQALSKQDNDSAQYQQRQERALRMAEDKLAQTMALLDDRQDQVDNLNATVKNLKSKMSVHQEGAHEAEEELDELHTENETLRHHVQAYEAQCAELRAKVSELEGDSDKLSGLKIELRMLREDYEREKSKKKSFAASAESSTAQLESERDVAQAGVLDLRQQLAAALADIEVARSDTNRVMMANNNLQSALEAFQSEREAELSMLEEQRLEADQATVAAHTAALEATREANEARVREIQQAADAAVKNSMSEVKQLEAKSEKFRMENIQMRRSLDEAINRLQSTQEDVIDRTLMKNILLDWLTKASSKDKKPILEVMASVLHFTDEEKEKVNIDDSSLALRKAVMGRVAAPFPPSKADMEHLEGDNVREKWVNFLLAETDDD